MAEPLVIFGTGTLAEIAAYYLAHDGGYEICGHTDMPEFLTSDTAARLGRPVVPWPDAVERFPPATFTAFVAVGYRKTKIGRASCRERVCQYV